MAVGTVVLTQQLVDGPVRAAIITATGSSTDGTFPATTLGALGIQLVETGGTLLALATNPGAVAPTDNYDITLVDGDGLDRLNGVGVDRDTTTSERVAVSGISFVAVGETLTLTIANSSVNSAVIVITLYWTTVSAVAVLPSAGVGGNTPIERRAPAAFTWTPTIDTAAYATGDSLYTAVTDLGVVGASGGTFLVEKLTVLDLSTPATVNNPSALDVLFFKATMTPAAANAANAISDGDMANMVGYIPVGTYTTGTINAFGEWNGQKLLALGAQTHLYVCVTVRGTPTYGTAGDLIFTLYGRALS